MNQVRLAYICLLAALLAIVGCSTVTQDSSGSSPKDSGSRPAQPTQSPNDDRDYRYLTLPNQLPVVLISDPQTDMAAASLAAHVGSLANSPEREGLAHFLEHMLFLGTEKFPDPADYQTFINTHGGRRNAYTALGHTNYFFEIQPTQLEGALDRFSQFFIAPLFNSDYVMRERKAVEGEYRMQRNADGRRGYAARRIAYNPEHPASQFSIGNLATLDDLPEQSLRDALLDFYQAHYSANRMALVIYGRESLEQLEIWAREYFAAVPNHDIPRFTVTEPLFAPGSLPKHLAWRSLKRQHLIGFHFPVPTLDPHYREGPARYITNLLGHEGEGSLHAYLKSQGWIESLAAGAGGVGEDHAQVNIMVQLTESGSKHVAEIGDAVFDYIGRVGSQGVERHLFDEHRRITEISFDFQEKASPSRYTTSVASNMLVYPAEDVLRGPYRMDRYSERLIRDYLARLNPDNVLFETSSQNLETTKTERWFGVEYSLEPLSKELRGRWSNPPRNPQLAIPSPNPFLPEDLSLVADATSNIPEWLEDGAGLRAWYLQDTEFGVPRAHIRLKLKSPIAYGTAKDAVLASLYASLVEDALNEYAYPALLAGLGYSVGSHPEGLMISLSGYSDKQHVLLDRIVTTLVSIEPSRERFELYRDQLRKGWENIAKEPPYPQAYAELGRLVMVPSWTPEQLAQTVRTVELDELVAWIEAFLGELSIEALLVGNLDEAKANELVDIARAALVSASPAPPDRHRQVVKLEAQTPLLRNLTLEHDDAAMVYYVQGTSEDYTERARYGLLAHMIGPGYFHDMRTERQLGYAVFATPAIMRRVPGIAFVVQSPVAPAGELVTLTNAFARTYRERLMSMTPEVFEQHKAGLLSQLLERDTNLRGRSSRLWSDVELDIDTFDSRERIARALETLTLQQFVTFYDRFLERMNGGLIVVSQGKFRDAPLPPGELVEGPQAFQKGRPRFDS
ncbi:MAG: insulinase family protein [Gammaproteobacteria bacterium]|nr:insulinase family protein [Gammaproteobacteria bacterium]